MKQQTSEKLGTMPMGKLMLVMGMPGLLAQLINLLYSLVDRMYIGHIPETGALALTGVGLTMPVLQIISAFSALIGMGGSPLASIALGQKDTKRAEKILGSSVTLLLTLSAILTCAFLIFRKPILYLAGASDSTYPFANDYLVVYLIGTVFVQLTLGLNPFITAQGAARVAMFSTLIGAALNLALDPLFIFVFHMGVRGAAVATVLSQAASAAWILLFLSRKTTSLRIRIDCLKPDWKIVSIMLGLGLSPFIMQSTESLIMFVLQSGLKQFGGDLYLGSMTILNSVTQLISIPQHGFTGGVAPIISYNYGAGKMKRVWSCFRGLLAVATGYSALIATAAILFPRFFALIFTSDEALIELVCRVLPIYICGMLVFGVQVSCQTAFMSFGQAKRSILVALTRKVVLLAPLAYILPRITGDVMSIYRAEPIADYLSVTVCCILFFTFAAKLRKKIPEE